jgi:uncharacterized membrane protein
MPLGPLRKTCAQPAPKSRLAVTVLFAQGRAKATAKAKAKANAKANAKAKAKAKASRLKPVLRDARTSL